MYAQTKMFFTDLLLKSTGSVGRAWKAVLKPPHSKRFATDERYSHARCVWSACVFSAAFRATTRARLGQPVLVAIAVLACLRSLTAAPSDTAPLRAAFTPSRTEFKWSLAEIRQLSPDLPSDWTDYNFLVLEMRASSSERFQLQLFTTNAMVAKRIQPFQNTWVRAAIPLAYYRKPAREGSDLAATYNKHRDSFWININFGGAAPINQVEAIGVRMDEPIGKPVLEIRSVRLAKEDPGDAVLDPKVVVDEFGQWIHAD